MNVPTARDRVSTSSSSNVNRESRSGLWIGGLLVAVGLVLAVLVALTPYNDTMPMDMNNVGPTTTQHTHDVSASTRAAA